MKYRAHHLVLESELDLAPLERADHGCAADVVIESGPVPASGLESPAVVRGFAQAAPGRAWFEFPGIVRLLVADGRRIRFDPAPGADDATLRLLLTGTGLAAIHHQRDRLVLRGAAVRCAGGALLLLGDSGAGKSTLAAHLDQLDHPALADDFVALDRDGNLVGGFPQLKLWVEALEKLGHAERDLQRTRLQIRKSHLPLPPPPAEPLAVVAALFLLSEGSRIGKEPELTPLPPDGVPSHLLNRVHPAARSQAPEPRPADLATGTLLANRARAVRVVRAKRDADARDLAERVAAHFAKTEIAEETA